MPDKEQNTGRSVCKNAEDFFASSPSANLVSVTKKDTTFFKGVKRVLYTFFCILNTRFCCWTSIIKDFGAKQLMKKIFLLFLLFTFCTIFFRAQTGQLRTDDEDIQSWNDLQLTVPMTKHFDFYTAVTMRFGKNVTRVNDSRFALGFVYKPNKSWSFQPFYWYIDARNSRSQFRHEDRLNLRVGYRFPTKSFGLSHRSWFEYRMRRPQNSWRYRPSLTFDKDIPKNIIPKAKFYLTEEVFYDSILKKFSRNRFTVGITKTLNKKLSLDLYYMLQNDGYTHPGDLNVVGISFKIKL